MRIAVTGASGFVGGVVTATARARGHDVLALSRRPVAPHPGLEWRAWDLTTGALTDPGRVDVVIHAAAHVDDWGPWQTHEAVTVGGTRAVLDSWPRARIVLISSASVYPLHAPGQRFPETIPVTRRPLSAYARAKIAQEALLAGRPGTLVLRPHAVHGMGDTTLLPRLARARRRGRLLVPGSPDTRVHVTDVRLLAQTAVVAAEEATATGILNVADAAPLPLRRLVDGLRTANGWGERPLWLGAPATWAAATVLEGQARLRRTPEAPLLTAYAASHLALGRTFPTEALTSTLGIVPPTTDVSRWLGGSASV